MAKAKLSSVTKEWIDGETGKHSNSKIGEPIQVKTEKQQESKPSGRKMQTLYLSGEARRLLWHHRAETDKTISSILEDLVLEKLGNKYRFAEEPK